MNFFYQGLHLDGAFRNNLFIVFFSRDYHLGEAIIF